MKKMKKLLCCVMAFALCFSAVSCSKKPTGGTQNPQEETPPQETDMDLVKDGASAYRILLSASPTPTEMFAADELKTFFEQATGQDLSLVYESDVNAEKDGKFLAIGSTKLFENSQNTVDATLGDDGFKVITYGNCVLMNGYGESGKIYSVYEFLEQQLGFETYAADEVYVDDVENCKLKDFHITELPDFIGRDSHNETYEYNALFSVRKRQRGVKTSFLPSQGEGGVWSKRLFTHSIHTLIRPSEYQSEHPEWFGSYGKDLCYGLAIEDSATGRQMRSIALESLKYDIELHPNAKFFMVAQADFSQCCSCTKCVEADERYGGENHSPSGKLVVFVNMLAREVKAWLQEEHPERAETVKLSTYAYQWSEAAPVTYNEKTGEYTFVPEVVPDENVIIRFSPFGSVFSKNLMDETYNATAREALLAWSALGASLSVWEHTCPFGAYLYPAYNWHTMQDNYRIYKQYGVTDILSQGPRDSSVLPFHHLRNYLQAELMWDVEQDINVLIERFIKAYYKEAAPYMQQYFDLINANYSLMEKTKGYLWYPGTWESRDRALAEYYPKSYLNACLDLFEKAYEAIEKMPEGEEKKKALTRVQREELSPRFIILEHYKNYYEDAELRQMFTQFEKDAQTLGLSYFAEDHLLTEDCYPAWWNSLE